jgi:hypothetical protein
MAEQIKSADEARMEAALKPFGWTCGPDFWRRYHTDAWVFNLANAVERLSSEVDRLEAQPKLAADFPEEWEPDEPLLSESEPAQPKLRKLEGWVVERADWSHSHMEPSELVLAAPKPGRRVPGTYAWASGGTVTVTHHDVYVDDNARGES